MLVKGIEFLELSFRLKIFVVVLRLPEKNTIGESTDVRGGGRVEGPILIPRLLISLVPS